jgi:tRNA-dihydrouridine synthase B
MPMTTMPPLRIGSVEAHNATVLAPLAGITDLPFRRIARQWGAGLVCSEMISANGLVYRNRKTARMLASTDDERPVSVQLFGSDPDIMAEAAGMVEASGADILDVNFGCSVRKVLKTGSGAALMKRPETAGRVLAAMRRAVRIPLTIKIRSGWKPGGEQALEIARLAEDCGVDAIAVHPRTPAQGFKGCADWTLIGRVKEVVRIPVIGNGDIVSPADAVAMVGQTGCDAVMIGRAAIGNPWLFGQIDTLFSGGSPVVPDLDQRFDMMLRYLDAAIDFHGERHACYVMRSRLGWFVKGFPHSSHFRESIKQIGSRSQAADLIDGYRRQLKQRDGQGTPRLSPHPGTPPEQ